MSSLPVAPAPRPDPRAIAESAGGNPAKIKDAARQFEGLLLEQVLATAQESGGWLGSDDDPAGGVAAGFAEQQLAACIAHNGGLGLSAMIATGLERQSAITDASKAQHPSAAPRSPP